MRNVLRAETRRLLRDRWFRALLLADLLWQLWKTAYQLRRVLHGFIEYGNHDTVVTMRAPLFGVESLSVVTALLCLIFPVFFFGRLFADGPARNSLAAGVSPGGLYGASLGAALLIAAGFAAPELLGGLLIAVAARCFGAPFLACAACRPRRLRRFTSVWWCLDCLCA